VIDPTSWVGSKATQEVTQDNRLRSAAGAYKALHEMLVRCGEVGKERCSFAEQGDPVANFEVLAERLKVKPAEIDDGLGAAPGARTARARADQTRSDHRPPADLPKQLPPVTVPAPLAQALR
jgi:hypothetical protein